jgi:hypothetical protein
MNISSDQRGDDSLVQQLMKKHRNDYGAVLREIREKYPNDSNAVKSAYEAYYKRSQRVERKAKKFAAAVTGKYATYQPQDIMRKALKFKAKYGFSNEEFQMFLNLVFGNKTDLPNFTNINYGATPLGMALGHTPDSYYGMQISGNDASVVQEILKHHHANIGTHQQVILQSLTYTQNGQLTQLLAGQYKSDKHNLFSYVHPVVAALVVHRIKYLDERLLLASVSGIVETRYNKKPIRDRPNHELYYDMVGDPNEMSCISGDGSRESTMEELRNRVVVQQELWKQVLAFRQGNFFSVDLSAFTRAIDSCRSFVYDSADVMLVRDEGTVLRRLLNAFSFRPTVVTLTPETNALVGSAGFSYSINPIALTQVSTMPIINVRLSLGYSGKSNPASLKKSMELSDWYVENKMIVKKKKEVIYSRDVLIFYINRRYQGLTNVQRFVTPYHFTALPVALSGFESVNDAEVTFDCDFKNPNETNQFHVASVVCVNVADFGFTGDDEKAMENKGKYITGSSTFVYCSENTSPDYVYDPSNAARTKGNRAFHKISSGNEPKNCPNADEIKKYCTIAIFTNQKTDCVADDNKCFSGYDDGAPAAPAAPAGSAPPAAPAPAATSSLAGIGTADAMGALEA